MALNATLRTVIARNRRISEVEERDDEGRGSRSRA